MLLLVDDRDGRVVAELESQEEALGCLEAMALDDGSIPEYLFLVEFRSQHGALFGTDTALRVRPLTLGRRVGVGRHG
jgi:hypothetical protein